MYIDCRMMITASYEIWCTDPVQCIDRFDTREEAEDEMEYFAKVGVLYDEFLGIEYNCDNFIVICPGENLEDCEFIRKEEERIRGRL